MANSILIIDDDQDLLSDLTVLLSPYFDVIISNGSNTGMQKLMQHRPDCLLLDINMKQHFGNDNRTEGMAFLKELRSNPLYNEVRKTPVLLISSSVNKDFSSNPGSLGADGFFRKPLDLESVISRIKQLAGNTIH